MVNDVIPVGGTFRKSRSAETTSTREGCYCRVGIGPFPLIVAHSQRSGRAAGNGVTAATSGAMIVIWSALVPSCSYQRSNGRGGKLRKFHRHHSTGFETVNLIFVLIEQPLHAGRDVVHIESAIHAVHQNLRSLIITSNHYIGFCRVEDVVVCRSGLGYRGFSLDEL